LTAKTMRDLDVNQQSYIVNSLCLRCKNSNAAELGVLKEKLERFASARNDDEKQSAFEQFREQLVYVAQREILQTEIPKVIEASITQQADWNQYDLPEEFTKLDAKVRAGKKSRWRPDRYKGDRAVTTYAATNYVRELGKGADPLPRGWGATYFRENYDFRDETWQQGVPTSILLEMLTTMLLVLKKCVLGAGGKSGSIARSMSIWALTFPIWLVYAFTTVQRRVPEYFSAILFAAAVSSLLLLYLDNHLNLRFREHEYLWLIPLFLLLAVVLVLMLTHRMYRRPAGRAAVKTVS